MTHLRLSSTVYLVMVACSSSAMSPDVPDAMVGAVDAPIVPFDGRPLDGRTFDMPAKLPDPGGLHADAAVSYPSGSPPPAGWPLLIAAHGYNHTSSDVLARIGMPNAANWAVVVTPNGIHDSTGAQFWNATPACCDRDGLAPDDIGYVAALIAEAQDGYPIDPGQVLVVGQSNGGFLAEAVACALPEVTSAVDVSGASPSSCARAPRLLRVHGTADSTVLYGGGQMTGLQPYTGAEDLSRQGCQGLGAFGATHADLDLAIDGPEATVAAGVGCDVELVKLQGSHHAPRFSTTWEDASRRWLSGEAL